MGKPLTEQMIQELDAWDSHRVNREAVARKELSARSDRNYVCVQDHDSLWGVVAATVAFHGGQVRTIYMFHGHCRVCDWNRIVEADDWLYDELLEARLVCRSDDVM